MEIYDYRGVGLDNDQYDALMRVFAHIRKGHLKVSALARESGVARSTINAVATGKRTPHLLTCLKLLRGHQKMTQ